MATKKYTFLFTLADGTTHSIPIEIPTGEDGGYYLPKITQVSDSEIEITFVPSVAGMPSVDSVRLKLQDSGGNVEKHNTDPASHADIRKRLTAANIVESASGETIVMNDSSDMELAGLRIFGKTTQDGTPTPEAPLELVSVGNAGSITVCIGTSDMDESPQTLTISSPNGLPGIPVSSGGNYTDENGQQWACDEIDLERGVYIQNVQKLIFDGTEEWRTYGTAGNYLEFAAIDADDCSFGVAEGAQSKQCFMCSHFAVQPKYVSISNRVHGMTVIYCSYTNGKCRISFDLEGTTMATYAAEQYAAGNPVTVLYQRAVPIETALSAEELAQYANAALHTNYPNTTVFNDGGAGMEVKYVADTKLYIDKKFAELSTALLNQ